MRIGRIMVVGAGQMGSGIAQVAAQAGIEVILGDLEERFVKRGLGVIEKNLARDVEKGRKTAEEKALVQGRITSTTDLGRAAEADMVIEAIVENLATKQKLFAELDKAAPPAAILASNTSSLPITQLAASTGRADRFIGMHFMNPVPVMKLVEIIRGMATSDETYGTVRSLAEQMGKAPVSVNDYPGFVSNRILLPMINEAIYCLYEGVASAEDIDTVMKLGMNHPMGPLTLADFIGLDTCLYIMEVLYEGFNDPKYRPCPLLKKMVMAGYLGRKSGRGFFKYE
ncbi:MAG: 3-hydroxybutyryl-CoA dehydrogenase [Firmicutes bacterium]|nr:3-hydroxybutyryl-CoA dehydrogenase [Bacillota bacterium]